MLSGAIRVFAIAGAMLCTTNSTALALGDSANTAIASAGDASAKKQSKWDVLRPRSSDAAKAQDSRIGSDTDTNTKNVPIQSGGAGVPPASNSSETRNVGDERVSTSGSTPQNGASPADSKPVDSKPVDSNPSNSASDPSNSVPAPVASYQTTSSRKRLDKLKLAVFPQIQARILLPVQYQKKDESGQFTITGADIPHGIFMFLSMLGPEHEALSPEIIKPIIKGTIEAMKAECGTETPIKLREFQGLECRGKVKIDADVEAVVRGYVAGRRIYFVAVMGSSPWMRSSTVTRYLESFDITQ